MKLTEKDLVKIAKQARKLMVETLIRAGCGHPGGAFSSVDIMVAIYFSIMKIDPSNPTWEERDRFILSKGHSSVALYTVLHLKGFFSKDVLFTFRQNGSILSGHPDMRKIPGVEMSTGSLGHGLSVGVGLAISGKMDKKKFRVFVLMGDGEMQEGSIWEAATFASHHKLDNLVGIVDRNMFQIDDCTENILSLEPLKKRWESFGWAVKEIDGNNMGKIISTLQNIPFQKGKPSLVIAKTIKGKGISFMENKCEWHGKPLTGEYAERARKEVEEALKND